jgi:3-dehydroquinate dehydratase-1
MGWDTFILWESIVGESTKNPFGARIIGIVTASNRMDPGIWDALAECGLAEFRADGFAPGSIAAEARGFREECVRRFGRSLETILTIRLGRDGGAWPDAEAGRRVPIWEALLRETPPACDWLDVEAEEIGALPAGLRAALQAGPVKLLVSHHDFQACPPRPELRRLIGGMAAYRPQGMKVAVTCRSREELIGLLGTARDMAAATDDGCVLSMGGLGRSSRVLAPLLGCPYTYGYLTGGAVAPGQLSARGLAAFFRGLPADAGKGARGAMPALGPDAEPTGEWVDWAEARITGVSLAQ